MTRTLKAFLIAAALTATGASVCALTAEQPAAAQAAVAAPSLKLFPDSKMIQGDRISVEVVGTGPDLIFVPGLASSRETWKRTAERLRGHYRLHLVQVNGFAGAPSGANAEGAVFVPTAEAIDAYIVQAKLAPVTYIGHSLGGTMGLYLAEHHPEHLKKVMLVDSLPFFGVIFAGPQATSESVKPMAEGMRAQMIASTPEQYEANSARTVGSMVKNPEGLKTVIAWGKVSNHKVVANAMAEDLMLDLRPGLATTQTPITLLYPFDPSLGAPGAMIDGTYTSQYAPVPHKTLVRIDDSRHFIMLDQPAKFDTALDAFLAS